jgi:hypothetical protein
MLQQVFADSGSLLRGIMSAAQLAHQQQSNTTI